MKKGLQHKIILNESNVILCYGEINTKLFKKFSANHHKIPNLWYAAASFQAAKVSKYYK